MSVKRIFKFRQTPKRVDLEGTNYRAKSLKKSIFPAFIYLIIKE